MSRSGWLELPKLPPLGLPAWPWSRDETVTVPLREGLVLSGGGARGSFEIGALLYLYGKTDFHPTAITGTSVGSIVAMSLAQYAEREEQYQALQKLESIWRQLQDSSEMFAPRQWYLRLLASAPQVSSLLDSENTAIKPLIDEDDDEKTSDDGVGVRSWFGWGPQRKRPSKEDIAAEEAKEPGPDQHFHPLLGFDNEAEELGEGQGWTTQAFIQAMGVLPALGKVSSEIPAILYGAERSRSMYRPGTILRKLLDSEVFEAPRVATSGIDVRIAAVCLETGQLRYIRHDGVIVDRNDVPVGGEEPVDLVMAMLASCSVPTVFTPVPLGSSHYVDGGVRENLPVEACVGHLGVEKPVVIVCSPAGLATDDNIAEASILGIMGRSVNILSDECLRDEVAYARSIGADVIEPEIDVHGSMTIDPGLIAINIDYGWLRAQETMTQASDALIKRHREIIMSRQRAWALENELFAPDSAATSDNVEALADLAEAKARLAALVAGCADETLPHDANQWAHRFEKHTWETPERPTWKLG
ncbi:MAG: patatin-like phospholipase family protein [Propionibacteriaceae bacterium]